MNKISIIIPHHNSSVLLARLIESIPTSLNAEVIVIDDNSSSEEYNKIRSLSDRYKFILYNNEGKTAGGARNTGLKYSTGKWIIFADADDLFTDNFENAVTQYYEENYDIIYFNVNSIYNETGETAYRDKHIKSILSKYNFTNNEYYLRCMYLVPWGKMYKHEFITSNHITFEERTAGNDMWFSVRTGVEAKTISVSQTEIYTCTVSNGSITTTLSKKHFEDRFQATIKVNAYLKGKKLHKFQVSILYFIAKSKQFGWKYFFHVLYQCIKNRSNLLIGFSKILHYKEVLRDRQNPSYIKRV